jgi:hypothetical protein
MALASLAHFEDLFGFLLINKRAQFRSRSSCQKISVRKCGGRPRDQRIPKLLTLEIRPLS